jgi:hypothetical protein
VFELVPLGAHAESVASTGNDIEARHSVHFLPKRGVINILAGLLMACGGGSKGNSQRVSPAVTPPGTYALAVTAVAGNTAVSQKLTLVIQ